MAKQTTEEEFNLRRQTRRRLIGAVALVLFVVILLPVVFDGDPAPAAGNDIQLRIPDKGDAGEFQPKIDLPELDRMAAADAAAASAVANAQAVASAPAAPPAATPAAPAPVSKPKAEARPKVESKPAARAQTVPKSGWVVQAGAYANADTARNLQAKLSKQGYHAYTEKAGSVVRVRLGSYPTQDAAEKVKGKLEAQGMRSDVINLE